MKDIVFFYPNGHEKHSVPNHAERPARVDAIVSGIEKLELWEKYPILQPIQLPEGVLNSIHSHTYLMKLSSACEQGAWYDMDTYLTPDLYKLALQTAGGAAAIAGWVWEGKASSGFAICRPPGHHANRMQAMGFCLLNNVALAAEYLIQHAGAKRVAIIDLDLHHGNGTQDIFWGRKDVFYLSTHQSPLYPGTGHLREIGSGPGEGYTANLPLPPGTGDIGFLASMDELVLPLMSSYLPEMILVSAGFDPHWRDPLGYLQLSAGVYGALIERLIEWADKYCHGRVALFLEGGYDLLALEACGQACVSAILGIDWVDPLGPCPYKESNRWSDVLLEAKSIWQV